LNEKKIVSNDWRINKFEKYVKHILLGQGGGGGEACLILG